MGYVGKGRRGVWEEGKITTEVVACSVAIRVLCEWAQQQ